MNQYKYFVIILYVISACDIRINAQASVISNTNVHRLKRKRDPLNIKRGNLRFEAPKKSGDIFEINFGVLLPEEAIEIGCTYSEALPAIELAIKKLQQPGGLFEQYTISVDYRDTKSSSVHGTIAAFDLYTRQPQGFYLFIIFFRFFVVFDDNFTERWLQTDFIADAIFGPIESYSLAQIVRFAGIWETPVISPGGFAEAFTMKESLVNIKKTIKFTLDPTAHSG